MRHADGADDDRGGGGHLRPQSKPLASFVGQPLAITVCDRARDAGPTFLGDQVQIPWAFGDPAAAEGTAEERYRDIRWGRDEIQHRDRPFVNAQVKTRA